MMRAMSSAIAGLKAMQTGIDVIGNNISNVNTSGYKASRTTYSDVYYQTISGATGGDATKATASGVTTVSAATRGATNNYQVGYGATAASVDVDTSRNGYDSSSVSTNLYIDGEGYFAVADGALDGTSGAPADYSYTRVGDFRFDSNGELVNSKGQLVCGNNVTIDTNTKKPSVPAAFKVTTTTTTGQYYDTTGSKDTKPIPIVIQDYQKYKSVKIGKDGTITGELDGTVYTLGKVAVANIPNPSGLEQTGGSMYKTTASSGTATFYDPGMGPTGDLVPGALETSNVDLSTEMANMITTQRGFQACSKIITVTDSMLEEIVNMKR